MRVIGGGNLSQSAYCEAEAETATKELRAFLNRYADTHKGEGTILGELIAAEQDEERISMQETVAFLAFLYQSGSGLTPMMLGTRSSPCSSTRSSGCSSTISLTSFEEPSSRRSIGTAPPTSCSASSSSNT